MSKLMRLVVPGLLALVAPLAGARASVLGPDAEACRPGAAAPAVLVRVAGFKVRTGSLRVQVYGGDPADFLAKGRKLKRVDLPVVPAGPMEVCVALPQPGNYAIAVRHDVDGSGRSGWNDGGGFSRNPHISMISLKPRYEDVVIGIGSAPKAIEVVLNYRQGLSIGPVAGAERVPLVALLSNPRSTGNRAMLPRVRSFCAQNSDIFHYEVEDVSQVGEALRTIARVQPKVLVINGGDGTVQTALTEIYHGGHFGKSPPPVAVLPNGKTNLIALDLGAAGDPLAALERVMELARGGFEEHVVGRELISLTNGDSETRPVIGMFLGGAGLADSILFCRHKVYPLGLPNGFSHVLTALAVILSLIFGIRAAFLPPLPMPMKVSLLHQGQLQGRFSLLIVTTLEKMLLGTATESRIEPDGMLKLMLVDHRPLALVGAIVAGFLGLLGRRRMAGVHVERGDEIRIEGHRPSVILDGEVFRASEGRPIVLTPTLPLPFLRLAA